MTAQPLRRLIAPRSVAVVGASAREDALGTAVIRNLQQIGFEGPIFGVNPRYTETAGVSCFPSLAALPEPIEAVFVAVPAAAGPDIVDEAAALGFKAMYINASGYADGSTEEGRARQARIQATAAANDIVICGPNNTGILNFHDHVAMWTAPMPSVPPGPVAVITQSGSASMVLSEGPRDLGLGYAITCGNEAVVTVADYLEYVVADERVRLVILFLETIRNPEAFARAARAAAERGTRILALKIGRSESGKVAVMAHTGSVAGDDSVYRAFFRQNGIVQADDLDSLIELAVLFGVSPELPPSPHVVPITFSGGEAALVADIGTSIGLSMPPIAPPAVERIYDALPPFTVVRNPLDAFGLGFDPAKFRVVAEGLLLDPDVGVIAPAVDAPASGGIDADYALDIAKLFLELQESTEKRFAIVNNSASSGMFEPVRVELRGSSIPFLTGMREGLGALAAWAGYRAPGPPFEPDPANLVTVRTTLAGAAGLPESGRVDALRRAGLPMIPTATVGSRDDAVSTARRIGFPIVLKGTAPGLAHKSDLGLVRVALADADAVAAAYDEVAGRLKDLELTKTEILIQPMAGPGVELLVGVRNDPSFGTVVVAGLGGVFVEVIKQVSVRLGAVDSKTAHSMLAETAAGTLLAGHRGSPPFDVAAAAEVIARLSVAGVAMRDELKSIEVNPLIVFERGRGALGVDVLIE